MLLELLLLSLELLLVRRYGRREELWLVRGLPEISRVERRC